VAMMTMIMKDAQAMVNMIMKVTMKVTMTN